MNKSTIEKIYVRDDTIDRVVLDDLFELLLADALVERLDDERAVVLESQDGDWDLAQIQDGAVQGRESSGKERTRALIHRTRVLSILLCSGDRI